MRPRPGLALHGHLPDEQPGGGERHPARGPVRQRGPAGPTGRLRAGALRLHRPGRRPGHGGRPRRPPASTPTRASCPGSTWCCSSTAGSPPGWPGSSPSATAPSSRYQALAHRARPTGRAQRLGVPDRSADRSGSTARTAPGSPTPATAAPTPPYAAAGRWATRYDPADVGQPLAPDARHPPAGRRGADHRPVRVRPTTRRTWPGCGPSTSAWCPRWTTSWAGCSTTSRRPDSWTTPWWWSPSDHGEQLGDHGLIEKLGVLRGELRHPLHRAGPGPYRARPGGSSTPSPRPSTCSRPSPNCSGRRCRSSATARRSSRSSTAATPGTWRTAAHCEWDWRDMVMGPHPDRRAAPTRGSS